MVHDGVLQFVEILHFNQLAALVLQAELFDHHPWRLHRLRDEHHASPKLKMALEWLKLEKLVDDGYVIVVNSSDSE